VGVLWKRAHSRVLLTVSFRESVLVVYSMALAGMLAFTFTLMLGHIWVIYLTIGFLG
jgi:FLVCR family feline leukemia virus subgroup C receptor-related protein